MKIQRQHSEHATKLKLGGVHFYFALVYAEGIVVT